MRNAMRATLTFALGLLLTLSVGPCRLLADDARVAGGLSPNGKFEVVAVGIGDPKTREFTYEFQLRDAASKKALLKVCDPGYAEDLEAAVGPMNSEIGTLNSSVLWNSSSGAFAFNLRDSRRSRDTFVFVLKDGSWTTLLQEDPFPEVFKDLGVKEGNRCGFIDPLRWEKKEILVMKVSGDCSLPNLPTEVAGRWFEYEVKYRLSDPGTCAIKRTCLKDHNG
jgi:hypothetical protein